MKQQPTEKDLLKWGMGIMQARKKGGKSVLHRYGKRHFSQLGKLSAARKKEKYGTRID